MPEDVALDPRFISLLVPRSALRAKGMFDLAFDAFLKSPFGPSVSGQTAAIRAAYRPRASGVIGGSGPLFSSGSRTSITSLLPLAVSYAHASKDKHWKISRGP